MVPTGISSSRQTAPGVQMPHRPQATISLTQNNEEIEDWELRYYALSEENSELKTQIQAMELHNGIQSRYCLHFGTVMGAVMNSMSWNAEAVKHIVKNASLTDKHLTTEYFII